MSQLLLAAALLSTACGDPHVVAGYRSPMGAGGGFRERAHAGVDFRAEVGDVVVASAPGEVVSVSYAPGVGYEVVLAHPEHHLFTVYIHLRDVAVSYPQSVTRGQLLGHVGLFAMSGGRPHVHLELCEAHCERGRTDGDLIGTRDPMSFSAGCWRKDRVYPTDKLVLTHPIDC